MDYSSSGVDIKKAEKLVDWIKDQKNTCHQERILSSVGGFASLFRADFPQMKEPCLASSTDGVGTKLQIATKYSGMEGLGQDLVAMCINDLICVGATPLFFLDYFACGQLNPAQAQEFIGGVNAACIQAETALIGGETAEMPGVYKDNDFDCAGFAVGVVDRVDTLGAHKVKQGDRLIGLPSSGFHSNGYSLLRKVFAEDMDQWSKELLIPTFLYTQIFTTVLRGRVSALAHITGGGMDNILRVCPKGAAIKLQPWKIPACFIEVQKRTKMNWESMLKTLNCGIGLVCFVPNQDSVNLIEKLKKNKVHPIDLGVIESIDPNQDSSWQVDFSELEASSK